MFVLKSTYRKVKNDLVASQDRTKCLESELSLEKTISDDLQENYNNLVQEIKEEDHITINGVQYRIAPVYKGRMRSREWMKKEGHII